MEIIDNYSVDDFLLTILRVSKALSILSTLKKDKKMNFERIMIYDFYLKYPSYLNKNKNNLDLKTKYSYFHWKPEYQLYETVISSLIARGIIKSDETEKYYVITKRGNDFAEKLTTKYFDDIEKNIRIMSNGILKMSNKKLNEDIASKLHNREGY